MRAPPKTWQDRISCTVRFWGRRSDPRKWSVDGEPIDALGGAAEQRLLLVRRGARRDTLQRVEEAGVADAHLVDRKVALDQATIGAEQLETGARIGPPGVGQLLRGRRRRCVEIVERAEPHHQPAD